MDYLSLGHRQLQILQVLWDNPGGCTMRAVFDKLKAGSNPPSYGTLLTIAKTMVSNGLITSSKSPTQRYYAVYSPVVTEAEVVAAAYLQFVNSFLRGDPSKLLLK